MIEFREIEDSVAELGERLQLLPKNSWQVMESEVKRAITELTDVQVKLVVRRMVEDSKSKQEDS